MKTFKEYFKEAKNDINEFIGYLKGKYKTIAEVKDCPKFKEKSEADQEVILDELKADGWK